MGDHIDLRFRPSLLIFVGESGKQILEQVGPENLLAYLDKPLRQCVALLYCDTAHPGDVEIISSDPFDRALKNDQDIPKGSGPRRDMIEQALKSVQMNRRRLALERAGYPIPNPRTQIFIIGDLADTTRVWMSNILSDVHEVVRSNRFQTPICYVLNSYKSPPQDYSYTLQRPIETTLANAKGLSPIEPARWLEWSDFEVANFSYLYEHMISYPFPVFLSKREVQYATAEALFALIATGIPSSTLFEEEMRLPATFKNYSDLIGNLNTSMVMFPYIAARKYSSSKLGSDLIGQWRDALSKRMLTEDEQRKFRFQGLEIVRDIVSWLRDSEPRPFAEEGFWPTLGILRRNVPSVPPSTLNRQAETHRHLVEQMGRLFRVLDPESVQDEYESQVIKTQTWAHVASKRFGAAVEFQRKWDTTAKEAWELARERAFDIIRQRVDQIWPEGEMGFENARVFSVEISNQLDRLAEEVDKWRQGHDMAYRNDLSHFASLLQEQDAGWNNLASIRGASSPRAPHASPTMGGQGPVIIGATGNATAGGFAAGGGTNSNSALAAGMNAMSHSMQGPYHLLANEEDIADGLRKRALWKESLVPSWPLLGTTGFVGWLAAALTAPLTGLPPTGVLAIDIGVAASLLATAFTINFRRSREMKEARQEVLDFYRRHYIYRCEQREDRQRIDVLRTLLQRVGRIRYNLEHIHDMFTDIQQDAEQRMEAINDELFDSSITARDIFVANGELLQRDGTNTLETISQEVTKRRLSHPIQGWHSSPDEMRRELIRMFQHLPESLLMMAQDQAQEHIYDFTTQIVDGYFTGKLVAIGPALDKKDIWDDVLDRVKKPLYFSTGAVREPLYVFVCGNDQDLATGLQKNYIPSDQKTITVQTKHKGWLLVAAFFRSGEPGVVNTLDLFAPKLGSGSPMGGGTPSGNGPVVAPNPPPPNVAPKPSPPPVAPPPTPGRGNNPPVPVGVAAAPIPSGPLTAGQHSPAGIPSMSGNGKNPPAQHAEDVHDNSTPIAKNQGELDRQNPAVGSVKEDDDQGNNGDAIQKKTAEKQRPPDVHDRHAVEDKKDTRSGGKEIDAPLMPPADEKEVDAPLMPPADEKEVDAPLMPPTDTDAGWTNV